MQGQKSQPNPRHVNLVFQGGGVRGIAYAGALESKPSHIGIRAVGGTSAGSIVAALLAIGTPVEKLQSLLDPSVIAKFLTKEGRESFQRIASTYRHIQAAMETQSRIKFLAAAWKIYGIRNELAEIIRARGIYDAASLGSWIRDIIGDAAFNRECIKTDDLKIVAADINSKQYKVFSLDETPNQLIADAVLASVCIPVFFQPVRREPAILVDGGMLSNFPSYLFEQSKYPTIGFRLTDFEMPESSEGLGYFKSLLATMLTAHDKIRLPANYFRLVEINTGSISSTKFDLVKEDVHNLVNSGKAAVAKLDWEAASSPKPIVRHFDKRPHEALDFVLDATATMWETYGSPDLHPENMEETIEFTVVAKADYSTEIEVNHNYEVRGEASLFANRMTFFDIPKENSILDVKPNIKCNSPEYQIITIPAKNLPKEKAYVIFFAPAISEKRGPCNWTWRTHIPDDLQKLSRGEEETITFRTRLRATGEHFLSFTLNLLIDPSLGTFDLKPLFKGDVRDLGQVAFDGTVYRKFQISAERMQMLAIYDFRLTMSRSAATT